jgi:signal peptidase II
MLYFFIFIAILLLDGATKYLAVKFLAPVATYPLINNVFHLTYTENTGAAFSIFRDRQIFLIILTAVFLFLLLCYLVYNIIKYKKFLLSNLAITCIIGGGIDNLISRIRFGYVVDMFDFRLIDFAIFNVADIFITMGTLLLILSVFVFEKDLLK